VTCKREYGQSLDPNARSLARLKVHNDKCCGSMQLHHLKYGKVAVQHNSYHFIVNTQSCIYLRAVLDFYYQDQNPR
jgi:hypothetical protein